MKKIGFIVNPLAGIGGSVALKGSDGEEIVERAFELGAVCKSPERAISALKKLQPLKDKIEIVTCPEEMGENEAKSCGFLPVVIGSSFQRRTQASDTIHFAKEMLARNVEMILFAGGDGTARDIYDAVGTELPVVGIPAGTKMHSGIYATSPEDAGELAFLYLSGKQLKVKELEVMDIDEEAFRRGVVKAKLYGYLKIPDAPNFTQGTKGGGHQADDQFYLKGIAERIVTEMEQDIFYLVGSGTTCRAIMEKMGLENTLLGVDVVLNKKLVMKDVTEHQLLELLEQGKQSKIIVTPIGGQGYIFGRGNQQLSSRVIRKVGIKNVLVIATPSKIQSLPQHRLHVDTGEKEVDSMLKGAVRVISALNEVAVLEIV
ncbi:ATP-NAD kinase family protein [Vagococcus elongatus]|uniref:ATP-NAD kinase n=1 Tax=Vagococcus elongatus TaxID=180344 RepID=A0A430B5D2_9ENTE|nr:ATP-NAD kinase family protein [Vagococcus elongatus]RSU15509.1 ATP-NAD kinase [Vagococcus elongatus]